MTKQHGNSKYTKKLANEICQMVSDGFNIDKIGKLKGFPAKQTIYKWLKEYSDFSDDYTRARELRADWRSNRIDTYCELLLEGKIDPNQARVLIDADKWQAGKENPRRYGDKTQLTGADGEGPVKVDAITRTIINPENTT